MRLSCLATALLLAFALPVWADDLPNPGAAGAGVADSGSNGDKGDYESRSARFQTTYVWQRKQHFQADYSGDNSLLTSTERSYTFTTTGYFGIRPWQGGEAYLNVEVAQGVPFSNLLGTGGFTNGEITRSSGTIPKAYRQRLFLRQTWNQGGGEEKVEGGINQLAGSQDKNRFVLTVGNFSTLDVFDNNRYAKDPRVQFMNWGNMSYAAYDYAADARGFGWGFAGEWYKDDWTLRFGRMTTPQSPNLLPLDFQYFRHFGDQVEVEHRHNLGGRPGALRVLAWRNQAVLARYRDAINYGLAHGEAPSIFKVRNGVQAKYGLGLNVEQELADDLGFFLRVMKADGHTETQAFTEVDSSFASGLVLNGNRWGRSQDTVGVSFMRNEISKDRRDYLAAGGISFFIGDGALNYRPENIFETYYSLVAAKDLSLTLDYQRIQNPAYNADRGPVNVIGFRFHAEY